MANLQELVANLFISSKARRQKSCLHLMGNRKHFFHKLWPHVKCKLCRNTQVGIRLLEVHKFISKIISCHSWSNQSLCAKSDRRTTNKPNQDILLFWKSDIVGGGWRIEVNDENVNSSEWEKLQVSNKLLG